MKHFLCLLSICLVCLSSCSDEISSSSEVKPSLRVYPFKSAILTYHFDGGRDAADGIRTVYIEQWGNIQAEKIVKNLSNDDEETVWIIIDGLDVYTIDDDQRQAIKAHLTKRRTEGIDLEALARVKGGKDKAMEYLLAEEIQLFRNEEVAGYPCQVIQKRLTRTLYEKSWIYQGMVLKREQYLHLRKGIKKGFQEVVVKAQFDVPVDPEHFTLPDGIEIVPGR